MINEQFTVRSVSLLSTNAIHLLADWDADIAKGIIREISDSELKDGLVQRADLARLIRAYRRDFDSVNPAMFPYLTSAQKKLLRQHIVRAHYLHSIQAQVDEIECRFDGVLLNRKLISNYEKLLNALKGLPGLDESASVDQDLRRYSDDSDKPLGWSGMQLLAPFLGKSMLELCAGKFRATRDFFRFVDRKPLYLGWSQKLILIVINGFTNNRLNQLPIEASAFSHFSKTLSYIGFFASETLFAMELFLVMKNTLLGAWISQKKSLLIPTLDLLALQISGRKFMLLNQFPDSVASIISFLCLFNVLDSWPWGSIAGIGYRICQLAILPFAFDYERLEVEENLKTFKQELLALKEKQEDITNQLQEAHEDNVLELQVELNVLVQENNRLTKNYVRELTDWRFRTIEFRNRFASLLGLLVGLALFSSLLFPPALIPAALGLMLILSGASVCVGMTLLISYLQTQVNLQRSKYDETLTQEQLQFCLAQFKQCQHDTQGDDPTAEMKALYLEMKQLTTHLVYQRQIFVHQQAFLTVSLFVESAFPPAVILALLFLPTGISLGVILGIGLLNILAKALIAEYSPTEGLMPEFNQEEFQAFCLKPEIEDLYEYNYKKEYLGFFKPKLDDNRKNEFMRDDDYIPPDPSSEN